MRRSITGKTLEVTIIIGLLLVSLLPACRKEGPPLDRNRAPETYVTSAPPETTEADYKIHLYWRGTDEDGIVQRYIWYMSDTVRTLDPIHNPDAEISDWNPEARLSDYLLGSFTTKTDSVFTFNGYDVATGALVNRQAFHVSAVDDGGKIDPSPARLQFLARVTGIPELSFWTIIDGVEKPFNFDALDTVSMFTPFSIKFTASTVNNIITGYRWSYGGFIYPDENNDGVPEWYVPTPGEIKQVDLSNTGSERLPDGSFYFKGIARDEAGAISTSSTITGDGICIVVVNHDPDTEIKRGICYFTPQSGEPDSMTIDFYDGIPDSLPFRSRIWFEYQGWDDPKDVESGLEFDPAVPIKFQFSYRREKSGGGGLYKSSWLPLAGPEDTNPCADLDNEMRDVDSTTMLVGSYDYQFYVRSSDEQYRADSTPDTVVFYGNFPPTIETLEVGRLDPFTQQFTPSSNDTIYLQWLGFPPHPEGITAYNQTQDITALTLTKYYRIYIKSVGFDDYRDPPGSGIKGWLYKIYDPDYNYAYRKEGEWIFDMPVNELLQPLSIKITMPIFWSVDSVLANVPPYLGEQSLELLANDISDSEITTLGIRGLSPDIEDCNILPGFYWITQNYRLSSVAKTDFATKGFYIKFIQ
jgi:phage terminase large subunit-like protein